MNTLTKQLNQFVMTAKFREGLTQAYRKALAAIGVTPESIKPHIIGTATIVVTENQLMAIRLNYGSQMIELSAHSNSGAIEISLPEGAQYLTSNRPTLTEAERATKGGSTGSASERKAKAEQRRALRRDMRRRLAELHGIDLDADEQTIDEDEQEDESDE